MTDMSATKCMPIDSGIKKLACAYTHTHTHTNRQQTYRLKNKLHLLILLMLIFDISTGHRKLVPILVLLCWGIILEYLFTTTKLSQQAARKEYKGGVWRSNPMITLS